MSGILQLCPLVPEQHGMAELPPLRADKYPLLQHTETWNSLASACCNNQLYIMPGILQFELLAIVFALTSYQVESFS